MRLRLGLFLALMALLAGCATTSGTHPAKNAGAYRVGQPYQVAGTWYYPKEQPDYNEVGLASWYGPGFHGRLTADGEVYDQQSLTAAHATLPLPVNVRVTNLQNGRSIVLRVNDRGPFHPGRIIDVSARAAELLGFKQAGTAQVRVEYLNRADGQPYTMMASKSPPPSAPALVRPATPANVPAQAPSMAPIANPSSEVVASAAPAPVVTTQAAPLPDSGTSSSDAPQLRAPMSSQDAERATAPDETVTEARVAPGDLPTVADLAGNNTPTPPAATVADLAPRASIQTPQTPAPFTSPAATLMYVQVGAYNDSHYAMQTYNQVLGFGKASVSPIVVGGRTVYRVRLGPVADADEASRITTKLKAHGHDGAKIVMQ